MSTERKAVAAGESTACVDLVLELPTEVDIEANRNAVTNDEIHQQKLFLHRRH